MYVCMSGNMLVCKAGIFCGANGDTFFRGGECSPPFWMLKLTESWGKSKTDFKGEVGGFKIEEGEGRGGKNTLSFPPLPLFHPSSLNFLFHSNLTASESPLEKTACSIG